MAALREKEFPGFRAVMYLHGVQHRRRVDVPDAPGHGFGLGLSHRGAEGLQLAVQVGKRHRVAVYQRQFPHAGAGQALHNVAADPSQPEHDDMRRRQPRLGLRAPKHFVA